MTFAMDSPRPDAIGSHRGIQSSDGAIAALILASDAPMAMPIKAIPVSPALGA
jgi:hypothetical protein